MLQLVQNNFMFKYNSLIQLMNYLTLDASGLNSSQKLVNSGSLSQNNQTKSILAIIGLALSTDFSRYAEAISTKIILQELINSRNPSRTDPNRPRPQSQPPNKAKEQVPTPPRPSQKKQPSKACSAPKQQVQKAVAVQASPAPNAAISQRNSKKATAEKVTSPKIKKKIHKVLEVKKENTGKVPRVDMVQTAQIGRCGLGEKDRKKLKERLLMRHVRLWPQTDQCKRDRRELRNLH